MAFEQLMAESMKKQDKKKDKDKDDKHHHFGKSKKEGETSGSSKTPDPNRPLWQTNPDAYDPSIPLPGET